MKFTNHRLLVLVISMFSIVCPTHSASLQVVKKTNDRYASNDEIKASHEVKKDEGEIEKLEDNVDDNEEEELTDDLEGRDDAHEENDPEEKDSKKEKSEDESNGEDEPQEDIKETSEDFDNKDLDKGIADAKEANDDLQKQIDLLNQKLHDFINKKQKSTNANDAENSHNVNAGAEEKDLVYNSEVSNKNVFDDEYHKSHNRYGDEELKDDISNEEVNDEELEKVANRLDEDSKNGKAKNQIKKGESKIGKEGNNDNKEVEKDKQENRKEDTDREEAKQDKRKEGDRKEDVTVLGPNGEIKEHIRRVKTGEDDDSFPGDDY